MVSDRNWLITFLLCWFGGCFGFHSFYAGRIGMGIFQLLTLGGLGIWAFIDLIIIICGSFKDCDGNVIKARF